MGYTTDFEGRFTLDKPLTRKHQAFLEAFAETRRMARNTEKAELHPDPVRTAVGLPIGEQGGYFVGALAFDEATGECAGQSRTDDILDYNRPPSGQPGLWCQWVPSKDGEGIEWNGGEKFYHYTEWLEYLIEHFLKPWGYVLNGKVRWGGEERSDVGTIVVEDNKIEAIPG